MSVLALDKLWSPHRWISHDEAIVYESKNLVIDHLGEAIIMYTGGVNARTGLLSTIETSTIIVVDGMPAAKRYKEPTLTNGALFARDCQVCAYCGGHHQTSALTRDHIMPQSKGGSDKWMNVVTACKPCNSLKANMSPGQKLPFELWSPQGTKTMDPLYVPYIPCKAESMILRHRTIKADQMKFLLDQITNKDKSRVYKDYTANLSGGEYKVVQEFAPAMAKLKREDNPRRRRHA